MFILMMVSFTTASSSVTLLYFSRMPSQRRRAYFDCWVSCSLALLMVSFFLDSSSFSAQVTFIRSVRRLYFISKVNFRFSSRRAFCSLLMLLSVKNNFSFFSAYSSARMSYSCRPLSISMRSQVFSSLRRRVLSCCRCCACRQSSLARTNTLAKFLRVFQMKRRDDQTSTRQSWKVELILPYITQKYFISRYRSFERSLRYSYTMAGSTYRICPYCGFTLQFSSCGGSEEMPAYSSSPSAILPQKMVAERLRTGMRSCPAVSLRMWYLKYASCTTSSGIL